MYGDHDRPFILSSEYGFIGYYRLPIGTERKIVEAGRRQEESCRLHHAALGEQSSCPIFYAARVEIEFIVNSGTVQTSIIANASSLVGPDREEFIGIPISRLIASDDGYAFVKYRLIYSAPSFLLDPDIRREEIDRFEFGFSHLGIAMEYLQQCATLVSERE